MIYLPAGVYFNFTMPQESKSCRFIFDIFFLQEETFVNNVKGL